MRFPARVEFKPTLLMVITAGPATIGRKGRIDYRQRHRVALLALVKQRHLRVRLVAIREATRN